MESAQDQVCVGRCYGQREVEVTPELVTTYMDGTRDRNAWYSSASPFGGPVAPALILHSEVYRDVSWYLNIFGNLHARQEWELFQPMMVGDRVRTLSTIVDRYAKRGRQYVVNEVSVFSEGGAMLSRSRTHQSFLIDTVVSGDVVDKEREKRPDRRFEVADLEDCERISGSEKEITLEMCERFSGPRKNYHNDVEEARKLGFPGIVVQGMMSICFLSEMMTARFGRGWYCGGRLNVNLVNVLWQGERVSAQGAVREVLLEGSRRRVCLDVWCEKADGTKVTVGTANAIAD